MGVSQNRGSILEVPIIRIVIYFRSILGSPNFGKLPYRGYIL